MYVGGWHLIRFYVDLIVSVSEFSYSFYTRETSLLILMQLQCKSYVLSTEVTVFPHRNEKWNTMIKQRKGLNAHRKPEHKKP